MRQLIREAVIVALFLTMVVGNAAAAEVSVEDARMESNEEAVVDVVLDGAPDGLQRYNLTVRLADGSAASIQGVRAGDVDGFQERSATDDSVTFRAADLNRDVQDGAGDVVLASVVLGAAGSGGSEVDVVVHEMKDDSGESMEPAVTTGSIAVGGGGIPSQGSTAAVVAVAAAALCFVVLWGRWR